MGWLVFTTLIMPPVPHDSWVVGDKPYVSLHFAEAERYAGAKA